MSMIRNLLKRMPATSLKRPVTHWQGKDFSPKTKSVNHIIHKNVQNVNKNLNGTILPYMTKGKTIKGFQRGSKSLGTPTANFPEEVVDELPPSLPTGVYFGWASVDGGPIYKMVMSVGWNPFYNNEKKSMETHILHTFEEDFYGSELKVVMVGYIRPEKNFKSLDDLISAIKSDIDTAHEQLEKPEYQIYKDNEFFKPTLQNGHVN